MCGRRTRARSQSCWCAFHDWMQRFHLRACNVGSVQDGGCVVTDRIPQVKDEDNVEVGQVVAKLDSEGEIPAYIQAG